MLVFYGVFKSDVDDSPAYGELIWSSATAGPALFNHLDDAHALAAKMNQLHGDEYCYYVCNFVATPNGFTSGAAEPLRYEEM